MLTKAIILGKQPNSNKYSIRVPLFETAASNDIFKLNATLCCDDGVHNPFNVGDIVYIGFEYNKPGMPVILGRLSRDGLLNNNESSPLVSYSINCLEVTENTVLSKNTKIGEITYEDLYNLFQKVESVNTAVNNIMWTEGCDYKVNNVCVYNLNLYICLANHTASQSITPMSTDYWKQLLATSF